MRRDLLLMVSILLCLPLFFYGQVSSYSHSVTSGSYVPITGGLLLGTTTTDDQRFVDSTALSGGTTSVGPGFGIGFPFVYSGVTFDRVGVNANGWITLGSGSVNVVATSAGISSTTTAYVMAPFMRDLQSQGNGEIRIESMGTAPNRTLVVQWTNYKRYGTTYAGDSLDFQVILHETSNTIDFVYGDCSTTATSTTGDPVVGLKGANTSDYKDFDGTFAALTAGTSTTSNVDFDNTTGPSVGQTITFTPPSCIAPNSLGAYGMTTTSANLYWSTGGASAWNVEYGASGFTKGTGTLVNAANDTISISGLSANTAYQFYVRDSCGVGDVSAWTGPYAFTTPCNAITTFPATEDFEGATTGSPGTLPSCWSIGNTSTYRWQVDNSTTSSSNTGPTVDNTTSASIGKYVYTEASNGSGGDIAYLYTPSYDVTSLTVPQLVFYYHMYGAFITKLQVEVYNSATFQWDSVYAIVGQQQLTTLDPWFKATVDLSSYSSANLQIRFWSSKSTASGNTFEADIALDDITVRETPNCAAPQFLGATNVTATTASLYWTTGGATSWKLEYDTLGFSIGTGMSQIATNDTVAISGLSPSTAYEFYVRDICGAGDSSIWVGPFSFVTACAAFTAPYTETFDGTSTPGCWSQSAVTGGPWVFGGSGFNSVNCSAATDHTGNAGNFAWMDQSSTDVGVSLEMGDVDVSALTTAYLEFYYWMCGVGYSPPNPLFIEAWNGTSWVKVDSITQSTAGWEKFGFDVSAYTYATNLVKIRFRAESGGSSSDFYGDNGIDDVSIIEAPSCFSPAGLSLIAATDISADIYWTTGGASNWNVEYGPTGFTQGAGTMVNATNDTLSLSGLTAATCYDVYVRDSCGVGDVSVWTGPLQFCTSACAASAKCTHTLILSDEFGDGWNGSEVTVYQGGVPVAVLGPNFTGNDGNPPGDTLVTTIDLCENITTYFVITTGTTSSPNWSSEIGVEILNPNGVSVAFYDNSATADQGDTIIIHVPSCATGLAACGPFTSNVPDDTICAPGLTGFTAGMGNSVVYLDTVSGLITHAGDTLRINTANDTTLSLIQAVPTTNTGHVGPLTSIATTGFGNFTNGQWISVLDTIRIDSMTVRANGVVEANLRVYTNEPGLGGVLVQRGKTFTTGSATADYQVPVGVVLTPGNYYINVEFTGGAGSLFRAASGAVFPYVLAGLMSIDSTNFTTQTRLYYTFDMVVTEVCLGSPVSATSYILGLSAGADQSLILCDNGAAEDLTTYLSPDADAGGTFVSSNASSAISGNMFNPSLLSAGTYQVYYTTIATSTCAADSSLFEIEIQACLSCSGLTTPTLTSDTICGSGQINLTATPSGTDIVWFNPQNRVEGYGTTLTTDISATTQFTAQAILSSGPSIIAGPPQSLNVNAYPTANFTNGQYISVAQDVRIDSAVFAVNGPLDFVVAIQDAQRTDTLQVSKLISFSSGDTAPREVGIYLTPGVYFINTIPINGSGILWRPTAGANFPYGAANILSVDSSDFGPTRLYYLYEMKVSVACLSTPDSTYGVIVSGTNAGTSDSVNVCGSNSMVDLGSYLGPYDTGGTWYDDNSTGAMSTTGIFDATMVSAGTYSFTYGLSAASGCPGDSATVTVTVASANTAGMDTTVSACTTQNSLALKPLLPGSANGGAWIDVDGSGALVGNTFFVSTVSPGTYRFTYHTPAGICPADSATVSVVVSSGVDAGTFANDTICDSSSVFDLNTLLDSSATTGGSWVDVSASGGLSGSMFNPGAVTAGQSYTFRYVVTNACGSDSAEVMLYVEDCMIGLKDYLAGNLVVYPNPTTGKFTIELNGETMKDMNVQIFGLSGKLLVDESFEDTAKATIDLSSMPKGVYTIKVFTEQGVVIRQITKM